MSYDIEGHIPMQMENLLNSYQKADVAGLERSLDNIVNIIHEKSFRDTIIGEKTRKENRLAVLQNEAQAAENLFKKKMDEMDILEKDYWNNIKEYITLYLKKKYRSEEDDA